MFHHTKRLKKTMCLKVEQLKGSEMGPPLSVTENYYQTYGDPVDWIFLGRLFI